MNNKEKIIIKINLIQLNIFIILIIGIKRKNSKSKIIKIIIIRKKLLVKGKWLFIKLLNPHSIDNDKLIYLLLLLILLINIIIIKIIKKKKNK